MSGWDKAGSLRSFTSRLLAESQTRTGKLIKGSFPDKPASNHRGKVMTMKLKKLSEQTIVLTGASSGIGLATARLAAQRGARLVLAARSREALQQLRNELTQGGGQAIFVVADVSRADEVRELARAAEATYGGFDTWINNAGVGLYGKLEEVSLEDMRRLFEVNFWSVVYGSLEAARHFRQRANGVGGALLNVGSTTSDRAAPLLGIYSASKHAIKGFTDALRMELEEEGAPVSVTLVKPGPIDTPFTMNAKNYLDTAPQHVPPVYAPETVARALLYCAETPVRDVYVGGGGKGQAALGYYAPRMADKLMEKLMIPGTHSERPARPRTENALDQPSERLAERGDYTGHVAQSSLYTQASLHPVLTGAALAGAGLTVAALLGGVPKGFRWGRTRRRGLWS
jgi:short-subunit dehydrogenase